jgi:hypothetical protein
MDKIEKDGTIPHASHVAKAVPIPKVLKNESPILSKMGLLFYLNHERQL